MQKSPKGKVRVPHSKSPGRKLQEIKEDTEPKRSPRVR